MATLAKAARVFAPYDDVLASFRKLLGQVPAEARASFNDQVLALMSEQATE